jgi:hypothetical protein
MLNLCVVPLATIYNDNQYISHTYLPSEPSPNTVFINREHVDWGPAKQGSALYEGFSIPTFFTADVISHDYHLH